MTDHAAAWGTVADYNPAWAIPRQWRLFHDAGRSFGAATGPEVLLAGHAVKFQPFVGGLIYHVHGATPWLRFDRTPTPPREYVIPFDRAHLTNPQAQMDGAGVVFIATRLSSDIGGVVYRVEGERAVEVLRRGPDIAHANGELVVWPDGHGYYVTVDRDQTNIRIVPIPGWVRL